MNYFTVLEELKAHGQEQLLDYYGELSEEKKSFLLKRCKEIDFSVLDAKEEGSRKIGKLAPADTLSLSEIKENGKKYREVGLRVISEGKVAAVLLAGGQGSRLGSSAPKGMYDMGLTRELSIFACQMENVKQTAAEAGYDFHLFVMTSEINDKQTREFFEQKGYFGYNKQKIHFFIQDMTPACSFEGKVLLSEKHSPALVPNGNGGWYTSLLNGGYGALLKEEGIKWLNVYGVDNVLQKICDPVFVGATTLSGVSCSGKVVNKSYPSEKVGVLCKEDGVPTVIEYIDMPEELQNMRDGDGQLTYRAGVILNYLFSVEKLNAVCGGKLPYHVQRKKVAYIESGELVQPTEPNAYKFELLAVDLVKLMGSCLAFEVEREKEFAPVKNATGVDSVDSARELLVKNGVKL